MALPNRNSSHAKLATQDGATSDNKLDYTVKYTLTDAEIAALSTRLLAERPPQIPDALVMYRLEGTDELSNLGRHIEREVFEERFGNTDADMQRVYGAYEASSVFFLVMDRGLHRPAGTMRNIHNSPEAGLLALRDAGAYAGLTVDTFMRAYGLESLDTVWDIGTLAIPAAYRDHGEHHIVAMLYRGAHLRGRLEGMTHYVALVDRHLYRTFKMMGFAFYPMAGLAPFAYEGSDSVQPVCGVARDFFPSVERKMHDAGEDLKPVLEYFSKRFVHGHNVDHRLLFSHAMWPGGTSPLSQASKRKREGLALL
ncbi:hypothetical protein PFICI_02708 [Pestalotiopsis fici W106-1]|uniref:Uncharacterized protein n=1 Tax=Pestalotiopsis fici (strain W106-1 / CGMCC3.15140) TaxID=1229662 RepID=W3XF04_PESFW|nr:uncharacterized protein PFICI_02708 [Pestalotiopsis fici W106-1]ETS84683.1 hypothetical protein PFICI_02708 [Pestalotiopsis fici W106-1]